MKKIISLLITSIILISSITHVSATDISVKSKQQIDTILEKKVFATFSKAKLKKIHTNLSQVDVEKITSNIKKQALIKYIIKSFNKKYNKNHTEEKEDSPKITPNTNAVKMLEEINKLRKKEGKTELTFNNTLNKLALEHVKNMYDNKFYSHTLPNGTTFQQRVEASGYEFSAGENIARGSDKVELILNAWMNSEGHKKNILRDEFIETGLANHNGYWVQIFGAAK